MSGGGGLWLPPERDFERFVEEMSRPERLEAEMRRLFERLGVDRALRDVRFDPLALGAALEAEADAPVAPGAAAGALAASRGRLVARLVTAEAREAAARALASLGRSARDLRDAVAVHAVVASIAAETEDKVPAAKIPLWGAVLEASMVEWPLRAWIRERLVEGARADALGAREEAGGSGPVPLRALVAALAARLGPGAGLADLERFIAEDRRAAVVRAHAPALGAPRILRRWLIARDDLIPEVRIPFERALHGAQVEARLRERGARLVATAAPGGPAALPAEASRAWTDAIARDLALVAPVYRARCLEWIAQALAARDEGPFETAVGQVLALDAPEAAVEHIGLFANYERSVREAPALAAGPAEREAIEAVLAAPLDPAPYRAFVERLRASGQTERAEVAERAVAELFPAGD